MNTVRKRQNTTIQKIASLIWQLQMQKKKQDIADKSADTKTYCRQNDLHSQSFNLQSKGHNTARCDYKPGQRRSPTEKSQLPINLF